MFGLMSICGACMRWPVGAYMPHDVPYMGSRSNMPKTQRAFKTQWMKRLGKDGPFLSSYNFTGQVALHPTRPILAVVGFDRDLQFRHSKSGELLWREKIDNIGSGAAYFDQNILLFATRDARLNAYDIKHKKVVWRRQFNGVINTPLTLDKSTIYVCDGSNSLYALDRTTGDLKWQRKREAPVDFNLYGESKPLVHNNIVYMGFSDGHFMAFDTSSGTPLWDRDLAKQSNKFEDVDSDPLIINDTLYIASAASGIYALDPKNGKTQWFHAVQGVITLGQSDEDLLVGLHHGSVARFSTKEKNFVWRVKFASEGVPSRFIYYPHTFVTTLSRGGLYVLDSQSGALRDEFHPGQGILAPLSVDPEGWFYVSSLRGFLYAFKHR